MANGVFNIAKGRIVELYNRVENNDPTNAALIIVPLQLAEADATLIDYDDLDALLTQAGNTEQTTMGRKTLTDTELAALPAPDDTGDTYDVTFPNVTWASATGSAVVKVLVCYDSDTTGGTDANIIPLTHHDFSVTPDGSDITLQTTNGWFSAA